jgi:hypothetical protein
VATLFFDPAASDRIGRLSNHGGGNEQQKRTTDGSTKDCGTFSDEQHSLPPVDGFCGGTVSSSDKASMKMRKRNVSGCKEVHQEPVKSSDANLRTRHYSIQMLLKEMN